MSFLISLALIVVCSSSKSSMVSAGIGASGVLDGGGSSRRLRPSALAFFSPGLQQMRKL